MWIKVKCKTPSWNEEKSSCSRILTLVSGRELVTVNKELAAVCSLKSHTKL